MKISESDLPNLSRLNGMIRKDILLLGGWRDGEIVRRLVGMDLFDLELNHSLTRRRFGHLRFDFVL